MTFGGAFEDGLGPNIALGFPLTAGSLVPFEQSLPNRVNFDQPTVIEMLKEIMRASAGWQFAHGAAYDGLKFPGLPLVPNIIMSVLDSLLDRFSFGLIDLEDMDLENIWDAVGVGGTFLANWAELWLALTGETGGGLVDIEAWFGNLKDFFANIDFSNPGFNVLESATAFIQNILHPTGTIATEWTFTGFLETALTFDYDFPVDFAAVSVTDTIVQRFFDHIRLFLHSDFTDGDFDLITAVEAFITSILKPRGMLAELVDGILPDGQAPAIVGEIVAAIGSSISEVVAFFQRLRAFLSADFLDPDFNLAGAVEEFIDSVLLPRGRLAELVDGVLPDIQAPALITEVRDAVGGVIGASLADMENRLQHLATGTGLLDATWLDNIDLIPVLPDHRVPGLELTRDNIVGRLFGWLGSGFSHDDESNALGQQTDVVITHTAQVDMLWAALNGLAAEVHEVTLNSYTDNFSRSGSNLGSNWGEHYNTGGFHWECNGSDAVVDRDAFNTDCRNYNVFTLGTSGTDYQTITVNLGSAPTSTIGGHNGGNLACGRMSADGSSRIEFFVRANRAWELAKVIAGSRTVMSSGTLSVVPGAGSLLTLVCGDKAASNPRSYSCKVGTTVVVPMSTFGDSTSNYGSSYRYMGNGGDMDGGPFATGDPGKMNLWIGQDTP